MKIISVLIVLAVFINNLSKPVVLKLFVACPTSEAKNHPNHQQRKKGKKSWILLIQGAYHQCNSIKRIPPLNKEKNQTTNISFI